MKVGSYPAGANGLYDMAGNVWEWTNSEYRYYPYNADDGRESLSNAARVYRGGAYPITFMRCANRYFSDPVYHTNYLGFRVVFPGP